MPVAYGRSVGESALPQPPVDDLQLMTGYPRTTYPALA